MISKLPKVSFFISLQSMLEMTFVMTCLKIMPGLHCRQGYSSRLSRNCEWDEVRTNVDIHTLVRELRNRYNSRKSQDSREVAQLHSSTFFTKLQTTIYIQELNENVITVPSITRRDILVSFDSGLIYWHVSKSFETRQEQVENVTDKTNVPFTNLFLSCVVSTRMSTRHKMSQYAGRKWR